MYYYAVCRGTGIVRNLNAGYHGNEIPCSSGRIFNRYFSNPGLRNARTADGTVKLTNGFRFVVFNGNDGIYRIENVLKNSYSFNNSVGSLPH